MLDLIAGVNLSVAVHQVFRILGVGVYALGQLADLVHHPPLQIHQVQKDQHEDRAHRQPQALEQKGPQFLLYLVHGHVRAHQGYAPTSGVQHRGEHRAHVPQFAVRHQDVLHRLAGLKGAHQVIVGARIGVYLAQSA